MLLLNKVEFASYMSHYYGARCICGLHIKNICEIGFNCFYNSNSPDIMFSSAYLHRPKSFQNDKQNYGLHIGNERICVERIQINTRSLVSWYFSCARALLHISELKHWPYTKTVDRLSTSILAYINNKPEPRFRIHGRPIY
jgi:hypothetical protein